MATQEQLWPIYQIQQLDAKIVSNERTRAGLDDGSALGRVAADRKGATAAAQEAAHKAAQAVREAEMNLSSLEDKMKRIKATLYGGKVSNPKELQGYEKEFDFLTKRKDQLEDEVLSLMDAAETSKAALGTAEKAEAQARARWAAQVKAYRERLAELDADKRALLERREIVRGTADPDILREHDLAVRRRKLLVGRVEDDTCSACGMLLPGRMIKDYKTNPSIELSCPTPTCGALLMWKVPAE